MNYQGSINLIRKKTVTILSILSFVLKSITQINSIIDYQVYLIMLMGIRKDLKNRRILISLQILRFSHTKRIDPPINQPWFLLMKGKKEWIILLIKTNLKDNKNQIIEMYLHLQLIVKLQKELHRENKGFYDCLIKISRKLQ